MMHVEGPPGATCKGGAFEGIRGWKRRSKCKSGVGKPRLLPPPLGIIEVIHAASIGVSMSRWKGILNVATSLEAEVVNIPEKTLRVSRDPITFNEANLEVTSQLHDDVLVVTSRIRGFLVKRVMRSCILTCIRGWG